MLDRGMRDMLDPPALEGDSDGWLMSYLDVLTLLITLFVLLLSLAGNGIAIQGSRHGGESAAFITPQAEAAARMVAGSGLKPRHEACSRASRGSISRASALPRGSRASRCVSTTICCSPAVRPT
ncbi:flagellar motor protein MotB [Halomonas sp. BC04]|uniref:flagellar motor protein MotB n=1 Tax=Halomonas sp. BC04 TaxID=1403540 RepID=UPI0004B40BC7